MFSAHLFIGNWLHATYHHYIPDKYIFFNWNYFQLFRLFELYTKSLGLKLQADFANWVVSRCRHSFPIIHSCCEHVWELGRGTHIGENWHKAKVIWGSVFPQLFLLLQSRMDIIWVLSAGRDQEACLFCLPSGIFSFLRLEWPW